MKNPLTFVFVDVQEDFSPRPVRFPVVQATKGRHQSPLPHFSESLERCLAADTILRVVETPKFDLEVLTSDTLLKLSRPHCLIGTEPTSDPDPKK